MKSIKLKRWYFRSYWWLNPALAAAAVVAFARPLAGKQTILATIIASAVSTIFVVQQQKLAETRLLKELVTEFTQRYDVINGRLDSILRKGHATDDKERDTVVDYFNLCAEEYLFFSEGYIDHRVWQSWCRGMLQFFEAPPFQDLWAKEGTTESYYGLTVDNIRRGAGQKLRIAQESKTTSDR